MKSLISISIVAGLLLALTAVPVMAAPPEGKGFDEFGYNWAARNFVGTGESWAMGKLGYNHTTAEAYMGDYAHDKLVMKWNAEWDRGNDEGWTNDPYDAWCTNWWNGMVGREWGGGMVEGSGEVWEYKIIWVGPELEGSEYWREGGYAIWGQFEVIMSQGTVDGEHIWETHATPNGLGGP